MRLNRLDLIRYGRFTGRSLAFPAPAPGAPDLHIIYGPNEAGKSTLFSAWTDLLFGIPARSRYGFLHDGPQLMIGAELEQDGALRSFRRSKKGLLDAREAPLPEGEIQALLAGLSRESYGAMFSLDDDTLEKGGDSILASRGDLGEMLFSASAGLASLTPALESLRGGLDGFHRRGKRSGWLWEARKELAELERRRKELEVSAAGLKRLQSDTRAAEEAWRAADSEEAALQAETLRLQRLADTLPLLARQSALQAELAPLAHLPAITPEQSEAFARAATSRQSLASTAQERGLRLTELRQRLAALVPDPAVLAAAGAIAAAEALRPEHDTALRDLPRRAEDRAAVLSRAESLAAELGQNPAEDEPALSAALRSQLRAELARQAGLQSDVRSAEAERNRAAEALQRARNEAGPALTDGSPEDTAAGAEADARLAALVQRLTSRDPAAALVLAQRLATESAATLARALSALAPWSGSAESLARLPLPGAWQITAWETGLTALRARITDLRHRHESLSTEHARLAAALGSSAAAGSATGVSLADAARLRARREEAWAQHRVTLSPESAAQFEQILREDDRLSAALSQALAEARGRAESEAALSRAENALQGCNNDLAGALSEEAALRAELDAALAAGPGPAFCGAAPEDLRRWSALRLTALEAAEAARAAEQGLALALDARSEAEAALRALPGLSAPGDTVCPQGSGYESALAAALARLQASQLRQETRRRLQRLQQDLAGREADLARATEALQAWQARWMQSTRGSLLAACGPEAIGAARRIDLVEAWSREAAAAAALEDRIRKMAANRDRFTTARDQLLQILGAPPATSWESVTRRLRAAEDAARDHQGLSRQIQAEEQRASEDEARSASLSESLAALSQSLAHDPAGSTPLADHIAACQQASRLRDRLAELERDLSSRPAPGPGETEPEELAARLRAITASLTLARDTSRSSLATLLELRGRLAAIGGDDGLARIAAARETLLLEIRERARRHLSERFGLMAFEAALGQYRDRHRSAMLARASDAFCRLSRGAYDGLDTRAEGNRDVLLARPAGGGTKAAQDLSKGTRFQLYLALRIAGYHELARSRPTTPFIADDIMETFDDGRSEAAFGLLGEMATVGQVIYLTHHRHLCDIAQAACPGARVINLAEPT